MRTTLLSITIAATLGLAACSNGSQVVPGGSQAVSSGSKAIAPMGHAQHIYLAVVGRQRHLQSCPSKYLWCEEVKWGSATTYKTCVMIGFSCSKDAWYYNQAMYTYKNHRLSYRVLGALNPDPGNPVKGSLTERFQLQPSGGVVKYDQHVVACNSAFNPSCVSGDVGIIPT